MATKPKSTITRVTPTPSEPDDEGTRPLVAPRGEMEMLPVAYLESVDPFWRRHFQRAPRKTKYTIESPMAHELRFVGKTS